jgi:hypothetical protein
MAQSSIKKVSVKHLQIDKNQQSMLTVIVVATILTVFFLVASKALISKGLYQRRAINARHAVADTLKANVAASQTLLNQYKVFAAADPNVLGGVAGGSGNLDGPNPRIVLDSLPSTYDAPALASSIEKIMTGRGVTIDSLSITDDPTTNSDAPQQTPTSRSITFSFNGTTNFNGAAQLLQDFERSIRPFDLNTLAITGTDNSLKMTVGMTTYIQPAKSLNLTPTKQVK